MSTHFFTNRDDNSLLKKFEGALEHGYGKGTSFTKLKAHRLHFFSRIYSQKMNVYALETNDTYGTKN